MRKIFQIIVCGLICSSLVSCSFLDRYDPGFIERVQNQEHAKLVKKGMTKDEVLAIMGEPRIHEKYNTPNIWFYYTDWDWADAAVTESECTPLLFKNDKLIGKGFVFYRNYKQREWLFSNKKIFKKKNDDQETIQY